MRLILFCIKMYVWGLEDDLVDKLFVVISMIMWVWIFRVYLEVGIMIFMCNFSIGDGGN